MSKLAGLDGGNGVLNLNSRGADAAEGVSREFKNRDTASGKVLLVTDVLVGGDEQVELSFGERSRSPFLMPPQPRFWAIVQSWPTSSLCGPWHALVQQDSHADAGASRADSERSRTRRAISRVTDGKHSRN